VADEPASPRKLASIVAVDMAGYSRRTESDEAATLRAVTALRQQVTASAAAHGGRVFNTAGDGFMLEFPLASSAVLAAHEIATSSDPPVRVGVHLGEVSITENGDLLGHGVNIAARIQQMAAPGAVLVSGDVKRSIRGPLGERLKAQGSVRLDKMSETLPVFALAPAGGGRAKGRRRDLKAPLTAGLAVGAILVLGVVLWSARGALPHAGRPGDHIAILPFAAISGGDDSRTFAAGLADELTTVLSNNGAQTVSNANSASLGGPAGVAQARRLGVGLILDGSVEKTGVALKVRAHLDQAADRTVLWSQDFQGAVTPSDPLQAQVAAMSTVTTLAARSALKGGLRDAQVISDYISAKEETVFGAEERAETFARRVVQSAPAFADGHASLAMVLTLMGRDAQLDRAGALRTEAEAHARRALALDPHNGSAFVALSLLRPNTDWRGRETWLAHGLAADPGEATLPLQESRLLAHVGRLDAAVELARQAVALDPLQPWVSQTLAYLLFETGQARDGQAVLDGMVRDWPTDRSVLSARFWVAAENPDPKAALKLLDDPSTPLSQASTTIWRRSLLAEQSGRPRDRASAAALVKRAVKADSFDPGEAMMILTRLGDMDGAFAAAAKYVDRFNTYYTAQPSFLFIAATAPLRRDRRFMPLASRLGLVDYWRSTGKWPDFCSEPGLPYDCKARI